MVVLLREAHTLLGCPSDSSFQTDCLKGKMSFFFPSETLQKKELNKWKVVLKMDKYKK